MNHVLRKPRPRTSPLLGMTVALISGGLSGACGGSESAPIGDNRTTEPTTSGAGANGANGAPKADDGDHDASSVPTNLRVDLRADTNRDGVIDFTNSADDDGEDVWDKDHGAVFLANIDDDLEACPSQGTDIELPKCNDARNDVVDGDDDALDLARLRVRPIADLAAGARATLTVSEPARVRLFKVTGNAFDVYTSGEELSEEELAAGVEFAIEGLDIVRDAAVWDGYEDLTLEVDEAGTKTSDELRMRVAPLLTSHHLLAAETTYVSVLDTQSSTATRADLATAAAAAGVDAPRGVDTSDQWTQDFFETGVMTMPGPDGTQHAIVVNIRSANESNPSSANNPLRSAGKVVYALRGKDSAAVQQFDPSRRGRDDTLNSFGNLETIPPFTNGTERYPLGRIVRGSIATYHPDATFLKMMESQGVQAPIYIDTSWLLVGHVDETLSFVQAPNARGWVLLANDPTLAKTMLEEQLQAGYGSTPMFVGKSWDGRTSAQITIEEVLSDTEVMQASAEAAAEVDAQIAILQQATGLTDAEIVRIPYLHMPYSQGSIAFQPGTVNGLYLSPTHFVAPDPHGPTIRGQDIFKVAMEQRLAPLGITVHWAEDWDLYHRNMGEIHCGTNALRQVPTAKWWESGR